MKISTLSIDLAKNVFQVAGFNSNHKRECNKQIKLDSHFNYTNQTMS